MCLQMTSKIATVQYKPVTSLAGNSHVATIKYHMHYPIFMACTGAAVISLTSYPYAENAVKSMAGLILYVEVS